MIGNFTDNVDSIEIVWFKGQKWIEKSIQINKQYVIYGKINNYNNRLSIAHPEIETFENKNKKNQGNLIPVYSSSENLSKRGINNKLFRELISNIFKEFKNNLNENLNRQINEKYKLITRYQALYNIHFPKDLIILSKAQFRLKYEEFSFYNYSFFTKIKKRKKSLKVFYLIK